MRMFPDTLLTETGEPKAMERKANGRSGAKRMLTMKQVAVEHL